MARKKIERKNLFDQLGVIKRQSQWLKVAEALGFRVTHGGKHPYVIRDPANLNDADFRSSVTTIPSHLHRVMNQHVFRQIFESPISERMNISEDDIWRALDLL
ncbi:MAG TPA: hypothetical protein VHC68_00735 [Candidatus Paceibacterota bacterium]|nr:hypothetical protein [Candidatus Paceibacterota bacterium]